MRGGYVSVYGDYSGDVGFRVQGLSFPTRDCKQGFLGAVLLTGLGDSRDGGLGFSSVDAGPQRGPTSYGLSSPDQYPLG